ncbi:hypothetical protein ACFL34_01960 [Candidatus Sumerlaeota bacterium]
MMKTGLKSKGPWMNRVAIRLFTVALAVLVFWLLGFLVQDIRTIPGPQYGPIGARHVDKELAETRIALGNQIAKMTRQIKNQKETQALVRDSSRSLQQTIKQLTDLRMLGIQKDLAFSEKEQGDFTNSLNRFLQNQKEYEEMSRAILALDREKKSLEDEKRQTENAIEKQEGPARAEYAALRAKHRLKLAFFQLAILLPILAVAGGLMIRKRGHIYFPLFLASGGATLVKVALVVHEYFPARYLKYIWIGALLLCVGRILIHLIRTVAFPKTQWLVKQYREAYERFLCPVCEYPIRMGPRRFLFWTRRTVNKTVVPTEHGEREEPYTCPSCGTVLFEECESCHNVRHALLPHCGHCGSEKTIE